MKKCFAALMAASFVLSAQAGPNWQAIESARQEKQAAREVSAKQEAEVKVQKTRHATSMEKLQAACDKAKGDAIVNAACLEMMAACKEMM
jgi:mannitol-specific phosphotransferase system IIBC component